MTTIVHKLSIFLNERKIFLHFDWNLQKLIFFYLQQSEHVLS